MATYGAQLNTYLIAAQVPSPEPTLLHQSIRFSSAADEIPPSIENFLPVEGTELGQYDPISFDVTDEGSGLALVEIYMVREDGIWEIVFDGIRFSERFETRSTKTVLTGGDLTFSILQFNGWTPATAFTLKVIATDSAGQVTEVL